MSDWINIDRIGTKGLESDLIPAQREPQSLDVAVNVRAVGPNLENAGGYQVVDVFPDFDCTPYDDTTSIAGSALDPYESNLTNEVPWATVSGVDFAAGTALHWTLDYNVEVWTEFCQTLSYRCDNAELLVEIVGTGVLAGLLVQFSMPMNWAGEVDVKQTQEVIDSHAGSYMIPATGTGGYSVAMSMTPVDAWAEWESTSGRHFNWSLIVLCP